mgnify:CR=1 FL=1
MVGIGAYAGGAMVGIGVALGMMPASSLADAPENDTRSKTLASSKETYSTPSSCVVAHEFAEKLAILCLVVCI